jgi:hypothetical protein
MHLGNDVVGIVLLALGGSLIAAATALDFVFRLRMARAGIRNVFMRGGTLNYIEYHAVRGRYGWPAWPVRLMWACYVCGIAFLIGGFSLHFGTHPSGTP